MFNLSDELIRQILFAMENQNNRYVMDTELGVLTRADSLEADELPEAQPVEVDISRRFQPLPEWTSADGFQLMERFLAELHNPVARNQLQEILLSGKRVFRRFKDTIREYPEVEKRYYRFKYIEMRRVVHEWNAVLRELAGLDAEEVGADQELEDLVLTEINIIPLEDVPAQEIIELDSVAFFEAYAALPKELREYLYRNEHRDQGGDPDHPRSILYQARTPLEEMCGFLWGLRDEEDRLVRELHQIYVLPEYRGLGVATSLLERFLRDAREQGVVHIISRLPGTDAPLTALMRRAEFRELRRDYLWDSEKTT